MFNDSPNFTERFAAYRKEILAEHTIDIPWEQLDKDVTAVELLERMIEKADNAHTHLEALIVHTETSDLSDAAKDYVLHLAAPDLAHIYRLQEMGDRYRKTKAIMELA